MPAVLASGRTALDMQIAIPSALRYVSPSVRKANEARGRDAGTLVQEAMQQRGWKGAVAAPPPAEMTLAAALSRLGRAGRTRTQGSGA